MQKRQHNAIYSRSDIEVRLFDDEGDLVLPSGPFANDKLVASLVSSRTWFSRPLSFGIHTPRRRRVYVAFGLSSSTSVRVVTTI